MIDYNNTKKINNNLAAENEKYKNEIENNRKVIDEISRFKIQAENDINLLSNNLVERDNKINEYVESNSTLISEKNLLERRKQLALNEISELEKVNEELKDKYFEENKTVLELQKELDDMKEELLKNNERTAENRESEEIAKNDNIRLVGKINYLEEQIDNLENGNV